MFCILNRATLKLFFFVIIKNRLQKECSFHSVFAPRWLTFLKLTMTPAVDQLMDNGLGLRKGALESSTSLAAHKMKVMLVSSSKRHFKGVDQLCRAAQGCSQRRHNHTWTTFPSLPCKVTCFNRFPVVFFW